MFIVDTEKSCLVRIKSQNIPDLHDVDILKTSSPQVLNSLSQDQTSVRKGNKHKDRSKKI